MALPVDSQRLRTRSMHILEKRGLMVPAHLPLLEEFKRMRAKDDILARLLCLFATLVCAFGFSKEKAISWLLAENLERELTADERRFIFDDVGAAEGFQFLVEGMWALAWVLGLVGQLDFWSIYGEGFASLMPDVHVNESSARIAAVSNPRSVDEVVEALDLAYCLHWNIDEARLHGRRVPGLENYVIVERRRALEWVVGDEPWDSIILNT
jgi:hypothetical protein